MAVGNRWCVCTVVHLLFCGCCGHLWLFVFMGIVVCGCYGQLSPFTVWAVIMCLDGGGKEKRNHVTLPNKHSLLSVTNKSQTNKTFQHSSGMLFLPVLGKTILGNIPGVNSGIHQNT